MTLQCTESLLNHKLIHQSIITWEKVSVRKTTIHSFILHSLVCFLRKTCFIRGTSYKTDAGICKLKQDYLILFRSKLLISSWMKEYLTGKIIRYCIIFVSSVVLKNKVVEINDATNNLPWKSIWELKWVSRTVAHTNNHMPKF